MSNWRNPRYQHAKRNYGRGQWGLRLTQVLFGSVWFIAAHLVVHPTHKEENLYWLLVVGFLFLLVFVIHPKLWNIGKKIGWQYSPTRMRRANPLDFLIGEFVQVWDAAIRLPLIAYIVAFYIFCVMIGISNGPRV